jgi:hypothetical protein
VSPALALIRSNMASWRIVTPVDGATNLSAAPLPQAERTARPNSCARDLLHRRHVILTHLGNAARPQLGRVAIEVVPPDLHERIRAGEDQRPGSLRSGCREDHGGRPGVAQSEEDGVFRAGGVHDGLDLGHSIIERANVRDRVRQPNPGRIKQEHATERGELIEEGLEFGHGPGQLDVTGEPADEDQVDRPVAEHLIRQAEIAALGV